MASSKDRNGEERRRLRLESVWLLWLLIYTIIIIIIILITDIIFSSWSSSSVISAYLEVGGWREHNFAIVTSSDLPPIIRMELQHFEAFTFTQSYRVHNSRLLLEVIRRVDHDPGIHSRPSRVLIACHLFALSLALLSRSSITNSIRPSTFERRTALRVSSRETEREEERGDLNESETKRRRVVSFTRTSFLAAGSGSRRFWLPRHVLAKDAKFSSKRHLRRNSSRTDGWGWWPRWEACSSRRRSSRWSPRSGRKHRQSPLKVIQGRRHHFRCPGQLGQSSETIRVTVADTTQPPPLAATIWNHKKVNKKKH